MTEIPRVTPSELKYYRSRRDAFRRALPGERCPWCGGLVISRPDPLGIMVLCCACGSSRTVDRGKEMPVPKVREKKKNGQVKEKQQAITERIKSLAPTIIKMRVKLHFSDEAIGKRLNISAKSVWIVRQKWQAGELVVEGYPPNIICLAHAGNNKIPADKVQIVVDLLTKDPLTPYRVIAEITGVSPSSVGRISKELKIRERGK